MTRYQRPTATRTYDAIHADISEATAALAHHEDDHTVFWQAQAKGCERLVNLWNEIVWQAVDDPDLPRWTSFAAMTTRDHYAAQVRDAHRTLGNL